jgi:hypothetical protein
MARQYTKADTLDQLELSRLNTPSPYPLNSFKFYSEARLVLRSPYQSGWYNYWKRLYIARFICTRTDLAVNPLLITRPYSEDIADQEGIKRRAEDEREVARRRAIRLEQEQREWEERLHTIRRRQRNMDTWVVTTATTGRATWTDVDIAEELPDNIMWHIITDNNGRMIYTILERPHNQRNA